MQCRYMDAVKHCIHRGMESTLRHGLSIELEQSVRCMGTLKTRSSLSGYKRHIEQHIEVLDSRQSGSRAFQDVLIETKHMLEQAPTFIEG